MKHRLTTLMARTASTEREVRLLAEATNCGPESRIVRARLRETANVLRMAEESFREAIDGHVASLERD